jgi:hypothetical protein
MKRVRERGPPDLRARSKPCWLAHHAFGGASERPEGPRPHRFPHHAPTGWIETVISPALVDCRRLVRTSATRRVTLGGQSRRSDLDHGYHRQRVVEVGSRWCRCRPAARDEGHLRPGPWAPAESWTYGKQGVRHLVVCAPRPLPRPREMPDIADERRDQRGCRMVSAARLRSSYAVFIALQTRPSSHD